MKFLAALLLSFFTLTGFSKDYMLTIQYAFKGIEDGYDHENKIKVYIDDEKAGESDVKIQSKSNSLRLNIAPGKHTIKIENWAHYNDEWELHDKSNGYSQDLVNEEDVNVTKNVVIRILYDLDEGVDISVK